MPVAPTVCTIVVNWNRRADTLACLASLARATYPSLTVIVVDNGSRDGSVAAVRQAYPGVDIVESSDNLGFAGGCNAGISRARATRADQVLLLNNDAEVAPDTITLLVDALHGDRVGAVAPTIYYHDRRDTVWSAGGRIEWRSGAAFMLGLDEIDRGQFGPDPRPVEFVSGCALLTSLAVLDRVGPFDPRFFAYYEETEWCVRARRAGYAIHHVPRAKVWHKAPPSTQPASLLTHYYMTRNRLLFLTATGAGLGASCRAVLRDVRTLASWTVRPKWRGRRQHRAVMLRALRDYFAGRFGRAAWVEQLHAGTGGRAGE
jgi:GT2 family glycosyltransferase